ncbi:MAG: DUF1326 domain-containing protein [Bacteroidota bacterium]
MRRCIFAVGVLVVVLAASTRTQTPSWSFKAEDIEACSCALFCPCYWSTTPEKDFCRFNMAFRVKEGHYGETKLDGLRFWVSGDLGDDFGDGETEVAQFAFEPSATQEQVDGVLAILGDIFPVYWKKVVGVERTAIEWKNENDKAYAKRADGKGEVALTFVKGTDGTPVVIQNMTYFGAKKNNGFHLARANHHAKVGEDSFAFDGTTGFFIELETSGGGK